MFWWTFPIQIFSQICIWLKDFTKIVRVPLASVNVNGLRITLLTYIWSLSYLSSIVSRMSLSSNLSSIDRSLVSIVLFSIVRLRCYFSICSISPYEISIPLPRLVQIRSLKWIFPFLFFRLIKEFYTYVNKLMTTFTSGIFSCSTDHKQSTWQMSLF